MVTREVFESLVELPLCTSSCSRWREALGGQKTEKNLHHVQRRARENPQVTPLIQT